MRIEPKNIINGYELRNTPTFLIRLFISIWIHRKTTATFPPGIDHTITFGDNLKALHQYLRNADFMSFEHLTIIGEHLGFLD